MKNKTSSKLKCVRSHEVHLPKTCEGTLPLRNESTMSC